MHKKTRVGVDGPDNRSAWHDLGDSRFARTFVECNDLTVKVPLIEEVKSTKSWVPHASMDPEMNGCMWVLLTLIEAFRLLSMFDTS
jgi:hypothetical protein